jgi:Cytochrome P450
MATTDIQLIQDELINILIAGRDTTASCITFAVYLLTQHPEVLNKLSEEVHSILPPSNTHTQNNTSSSSLPGPTLATLKSLPYLNATISETLRLFPPVPMSARETLSSRVLTASDGTRLYLPAGSTVTFSALHLGRNPRIWRGDAAVFRPGRFLEGETEGLNGEKGGFGGVGGRGIGGKGVKEGFLPFNVGPRNCLGREVAYAEVGVLLCRLVQRLKARRGVLRLKLDEEAVRPDCRVPKSWSSPSHSPSHSTSSFCSSSSSSSSSGSPSAPFQYTGWRDDPQQNQHQHQHNHMLHTAGPLDDSLPLHASPTQIAFAGSTPGSLLPATTPTGESPRKRIERVWPKSHLTMFVEGGVWVRT